MGLSHSALAVRLQLHIWSCRTLPSREGLIRTSLQQCCFHALQELESTQMAQSLCCQMWLQRVPGAAAAQCSHSGSELISADGSSRAEAWRVPSLCSAHVQH